MDWPIFALLQMLLITIGVCGAFFLHNRTIRKQNVLLRHHLDNLESGEAQPSAAVWAEEYLSSVEDSDPTKALIAAVVNNALTPADDFSSRLTSLIQSSGIYSTDDLAHAREKIADLEARLEQAGSSDLETSPEQIEELKALLQQFTSDSREMMACIQTLEEENASLRSQLEAGATRAGGADKQPIEPGLLEDTVSAA